MLRCSFGLAVTQTIKSNSKPISRIKLAMIKSIVTFFIYTAVVSLMQNNFSVYRGGHGFESRWSLDFFRLLLSNWKTYCHDHSSLSSTTAVRTWIISYILHNHSKLSLKVVPRRRNRFHSELFYASLILWSNYTMRDHFEPPVLNMSKSRKHFSRSSRLFSHYCGQHPGDGCSENEKTASHKSNVATCLLIHNRSYSWSSSSTSIYYRSKLTS